LAKRTDERINRLAEQQERTQTHQDQLSGKVDQLSENVDIAFQTITLLSNNTDRTLASINASIQRQDMDYLLRDRNGNGDGSQP